MQIVCCVMNIQAIFLFDKVLSTTYVERPIALRSNAVTNFELDNSTLLKFFFLVNIQACFLFHVGSNCRINSGAPVGGVSPKHWGMRQHYIGGRLPDPDFRKELYKYWANTGCT
jgi:hypothetical protein